MRSIGIRRWTFVVTVAAIAIITVAAPVAARQVSHSSGQALVAQAVWGTGDPTTGEGTWGIAAAISDEHGSYVFYGESTTSLVDCGDGRLGSVGTGRFGEAPADVTISHDLGRANASATMDIVTVAFDECTFEFEIVDLDEGVMLEMALAASGRRENTVDRYAEAVPHEYRFTFTNRIQARAAAGSVLLDGAALPFDAAQIGRHAWSDHYLIH